MNKNFMASMLFIATFVAAWSQTRVDLRTQVKNVDFSSSLSTKPVKVGTAMPGTCSAGEMFFKSDAPAGSNLFGCTATNTWTVMSNSAAGTFGPYYCADAGATNAYACSGVTGISGLAAGQVVVVKPATTNTGAATLNVNGLGAKAIHKNGSLSLASGDMPAGQVATVIYDGTAFQITSLGIQGPTGPAGPTGATGATGATGSTGPTGPAIGGLLTNKGDTVAHNGTAPVRMGVCADGQSYVADSTQANGWRCGTVSSGGATYTPDAEASVLIDNNAHTIGLASFIARLGAANTWSGLNDFTSASLILPHRTVSTLPAASANNKRLFVVTDGTSATDCTAGGGTNKALCYSNGTVYSSIGGGTGAGGDSFATATGATIAAKFSGSGAYLKADGTRGDPTTGSGGATEYIERLEPAASSGDQTLIKYGMRFVYLTDSDTVTVMWALMPPQGWSGANPKMRLLWTYHGGDNGTFNMNVDMSCDNGDSYPGTTQTVGLNLTQGPWKSKADMLNPLAIPGTCAGKPGYAIKLSRGAGSTWGAALLVIQKLEIIWPLS